MTGVQLGKGDDVGLETFKLGAVLTEEEQPHASPAEQWAALDGCLREGAAISSTSAVMREICDAVGREVTREARRPQLHVPLFVLFAYSAPCTAALALQLGHHVYRTTWHLASL